MSARVTGIKMGHKSFAKDVLNKTLELAEGGNGEATCGDVSSALFMQTRVDHKRVLNTLSELSRKGKLNRVRQGVYGPVLRVGQLEKREIMYRMLRMEKRMTVDGMMESVSGVSRGYVKEFFNFLARVGWVRRVESKNTAIFILIKNSVEMPVDEEKAARLRKIRRLKKEQIARKLDQIDDNSRLIRNILETMEDGDDTENI
jgi:exosome complex RNA-binding protein Csl4